MPALGLCAKSVQAHVGHVEVAHALKCVDTLTRSSCTLHQKGKTRAITAQAKHRIGFPLLAAMQPPSRSRG